MNDCHRASGMGVSKKPKAAENCKLVELTGLGINSLSPRGLILIPERDVYRLVMRSKLPSIRKTGGYMVLISNETPKQILSRSSSFNN